MGLLACFYFPQLLLFTYESLYRHPFTKKNVLLPFVLPRCFRTFLSAELPVFVRACITPPLSDAMSQEVPRNKMRCWRILMQETPNRWFRWEEVVTDVGDKEKWSSKCFACKLDVSHVSDTSDPWPISSLDACQLRQGHNNSSRRKKSQPGLSAQRPW